MSDAHPQTVIIIKKKRGGHHDGHHGGVWKIAYADFVTAMMAFFLVMWLINASNEETKAAVASYFNPVKLMDTTSNPKGVKNAEYGASSKDKPADEETPRAKSDEKPTDADAPDAGAAVTVDESVFRDPYAVLAEIAGGKSASESEADGGGPAVGLSDTGEPRPGMRGGIAYRDPFEPEFWAEKRQAAAKEEHAVNAAATPQDESPAPQPMPDVVASPASGTPVETAADPAAEAAVQAAVEVGTKAEPDLAATLAARLEGAAQGGATMSVSEGEGGLIIDMTDGSDFSMFELGSARPKREVLEMMERIAAALADTEGVIEISGHTDARPFKGGGYDNWRLSSARAQMAYYMLVRAGVPEARIRTVSGHADRQPKNPGDPLAPENRRIAIRLVQEQGRAAP
jgi:chemotaxis protein MotB